MTGATSERTSGASTFEYAIMLGIVLATLVALSISLIAGADAADPAAPCVHGDGPACITAS